MATNFTEIINGDPRKNDAEIWNGPLRSLDNAIGNPAGTGVSGASLAAQIAATKARIDGIIITDGTANAEVTDARAAIRQGGLFSPSVLRDTLELLDRSVNVKAFGAYGDGSSHLVGSGAALTAARAAYPLTHAAYTITATDEIDWCAIQEAMFQADEDDRAGIYIPAGQYLINRSLVVPKTAAGQQFVIEGDGFRTADTGTQIEATGTFSMFWIGEYVTIRNMAIIGANRTVSTMRAIHIGGRTDAGDLVESVNSINVVIEMVRFGNNLYDCIYTQYECDHLYIKHCIMFSNVGRSVIYHDNIYNSYPVSVSPTAGMIIEQCHFTCVEAATDDNLSNRFGIYMIGTEDSAIRNCIINYFDHAVYFNGAVGCRNFGFQIDGLHAEINSAYKPAPTDWAGSTAYSLDAIRCPTKNNATGFVYKCTTAGTSSGTEPTWPTAYNGTVTDGTAVWTAWRRLNGIHIAPSADCLYGALQLRSLYIDAHLQAIYNEQPNPNEIIVVGGNFRNHDTVYQMGVNSSAAFHQVRFEGCLIDGNMKPYRAGGSENHITIMSLENCTLSNDNIGLVATTANSTFQWISTFGMGNYKSHGRERNVSAPATVDWATDELITVSTAETGRAISSISGTGTTVTATISSVTSITAGTRVYVSGTVNHNGVFAATAVSGSNVSWLSSQTASESVGTVSIAVITIPAITTAGAHDATVAQKSYGWRNREFIIYHAVSASPAVAISTTNSILLANGNSGTAIILTTRGTHYRMRLANLGSYTFILV